MKLTHYLISEASKKLQVEAHVLRYWEEELKLEIPRNELGHRYYTEKQIALFQRIKELKELGYQLKAIKTSLREESRKEEADKAGFLLEKNRFKVLDGTAGAASEEAPPEQAEEQNGQKVMSQEQEEGTSCERKPFGREKEQEEAVRWENEAEQESVFGEAAGDSQIRGEVTALQRTEKDHGTLAASTEKMEQFQAIMTDVLAEALRRNQNALSQEMGGEISEKVLREMNDLMRDREDREEERYRRLDETIRACQRVQKQKSEAAATRISMKGIKKNRMWWGKKKSKEK